VHSNNIYNSASPESWSTNSTNITYESQWIVLASYVCFTGEIGIYQRGFWDNFQLECNGGSLYRPMLFLHKTLQFETKKLYAKIWSHIPSTWLKITKKRCHEIAEIKLLKFINYLVIVLWQGKIRPDNVIRDNEEQNAWIHGYAHLPESIGN
jgi:hypothetical protein